MSLLLLEQVVSPTHFSSILRALLGKLYDKFVIQCMKLLRQILKCEDYQMPSNILSSGK